MRMNYANMIEEKNLKKTFIIATLVSTLVGTFTSSLGLYERLNQKRKQKNVDATQDGEIKKLREQVEDMNKKVSDRDSRRRALPAPRDEFEDSLERSGALIRHEYDDGYQRLGKRYAIGDTLTENQLQAQVIMLQQTVINVLQDALYNNRPPSHSDIARLHSASETARNNSIEALRNQYQRMLTAAPPSRALSVGAPPSRAMSVASPTSRAMSVAPPAPRSHRSSPSPPPVDSSPLFCSYSLDLQNVPRQQLYPSFENPGDGHCPVCAIVLPIDPSDVWKIVKEKKRLIREPGYEKEVTEERSFHLTNRFVVKCHRANGEFACVMCNRNRHVDTVCGDLETLIRHVGRVHDVDEYEREQDIREFG